MATNQQSNLFAPPTEEELGMFAPPRPEETDLFAPPTPKELGSQSSWISPEEAEHVATKYGVDSQKISDIAPYYGINLAGRGEPSAAESLKFGAKSALGELGTTVGLGAPQFAYKKLALSEPERKALDELRGLSEERQSTLGKVTSFGRAVVAPVASLAKGAGAAARLAEASGIGAAASTFASEEGKELEAAGKGALFGLGLGAVGEGLAKLLGPSKIGRAEAEAIRGKQADIQSGVEKIAAETQPSERMLEDITFSRKDAISPEEASSIVREQYGDEAIREFHDPQSVRGRAIRDQIDGPVTEQSITKQLADDVIQGRAREFAESLTGSRASSGEDALEAIQKYASRQGSEAVQNQYRNFVELKQAERFLDETGLIAKDQPGFWGSTVNKISDNQYVLRRLDDKYGTDAESALRQINRGRNRLTFARSETRSALEQIHRQAQKLGVDDVVRDTSRLYDALNSGDLSGLSPQERSVAEGFQKYFQDGLEYVNGKVREKDPGIAPLSIPARDNYVPHIALPVEEQIPLVEQMVQEASAQLGRDISTLSRPELTKLSKAEGPVGELLQYSKWATGQEASNGRELLQNINERLHTREGNIALESKAKSALEREGEIPSFIRQKNLYKLADSWSHNTYNHLFLRNGLDKLRKEALKLRRLRADVEEDYVNKIVQDTLGIRKGTAAEGFMRSKISAARNLDQLIDKYGRRSPTGIALQGVKHIPEILYGLIRNIYPNLLGYGNVYAATQNLVTGFTRLAPELGTRYGYTTVLRGAVKTLLNFREYYKVAEKLGNVPSEVIRRGEAAIADGLIRSRVFNIPREGYQKLAQFGMKLFEKSEQINRAMTISIADMMAADLARKSPAALGSLRRFPNSIQRQIMRSPANVEQNSRLLAQYLNDTTQFNYNRSSLFEYGRTLGPVLATFTKWPTAILGEAAYTFRSKGLTKGALRNMERLALPFLLLTAVQQGINKGLGVDSVEDLPDATKKFVGSKGLGAMAPANALHGFITGEIFTPPVVDLVMKGILIPASAGDTEKLGRGLDTAIRNYAPGAGLLRFLTDDLVTYTTGHRPEGPTFVERAEAGTRSLTK